MAQIGRDLKDHLVPTPCHGIGTAQGLSTAFLVSPPLPVPSPCWAQRRCLPSPWFPRQPARLPAAPVIYEAGTCLQLNRDYQLLGQKPRSCHQLGITFSHWTLGEGFCPKRFQDATQYRLNSQKKHLTRKFFGRYWVLQLVLGSTC